MSYAETEIVPKQQNTFISKAEKVLKTTYDKQSRNVRRALLAALGPVLLTTVACDFNSQPSRPIDAPTAIATQHWTELPTELAATFTPLKVELSPTSAPTNTIEPTRTVTTIPTSTETPTPTFTPTPEPTATSTPEPLAAKEIVDDVEVYGLNTPINTTADLARLNTYFNEQFATKLINIYKERNLPVTNDFYEQRELVLDKNKRFLQVTVKRSVFENFQKNNPNDISLTQWLRAEVDQMNEFIKTGEPHVDLDAVLSRIVIVDDSFDERLDDHQKNPADAIDMDAVWGMWSDYRGDKDPKTGQFGKSAFLRNKMINGKDILLDYGLIHELDHMLLNWPDEYTLNVSAQEGRLGLIIEGAGGMYTRTPWFNYDLTRNQELGIRGYRTDKRALGVIGQLEHTEYETSESSYSIFAKHPSNNVIQFLDSKGVPISGSITVLKNHNENNDYYGEKYFAEIQTAELEEGSLQVSEDWFTPNRSGYSVAYPTNWIIMIKPSEGQEYILNMPMTGFNMSKLSGIDSALYTVQFADNAVTGTTRNQVLSTSPSLYPNEFDNISIPYASMNIHGTPYNFNWRISDRNLWYGMQQ